MTLYRQPPATPMTPPSPAQFQKLLRSLEREYGVEFIDKRDAAEMKLVAEFLRAIGVMDPQTFLTSYATTIGWKVYLPFTPGEPSGLWTDLLWQYYTPLHEAVHKLQYARFGGPVYAWDYVVSSEIRAAVLEAEAYLIQLEMGWHCEGKVYAPESLAAGLVHYACSPEDCNSAARKLTDDWASVHRFGAEIHPVAQFGLDFARSEGLLVSP
jgi:hypothetical protein